MVIASQVLRGRGVIPKRRYLSAFETPYEGQSPKTFATSGRVFLVPIDIPWAVSVDRILWGIGDTANGGGGVRAAIYKEGATVGLPDGGELIVEGVGSFAKGQLYYINLVTIAETALSQQRAWLGIQSEVTGASFCCGLDVSKIIGRRFDISGGYAAFPDPCPTTTGTSFPPRMKVRVVV